MSNLFTAQEIAAALNITRQAVQLRLQSIAPGGFKIVNKRQKAHAWTIDSLPAALRIELEEKARKGHFRDVAALLRNDCERYEPAIPLNQIADDCIASALKLRTALDEMLRRRNDMTISSAELDRIGCDAYRREFGHPVSDRYIRELFARTLKRAGSSEDFSRLELYLPDRLKRKAPEKQNPQAEIPELRGMTEAFIDPATRPDDARECVWQCVVEYYTDQIADGRTAKEVRRNLLDFLYANAGWLCVSRESLEKTFKRKLIGGTDDRRRISKKLPRAAMSKEGYDFAVYLVGRYENHELAWREWRESEKTPDADKALFSSSTWRAPKPWVEAVRYDGELAALAYRDSRTYKLNSAHHTTDPDSLASGDADQSDDLTLPIIWWDELEDGEIFCGQGQTLVWIDVLSQFYYGAALIPSGSYNGFNIRNSWTKKAEKWGLPRKYIHVEMGIWRDAKVFAGSQIKRKEGIEEILGTRVAEMGLRRLGIKFRNSVLPRGKSQIERYFGSYQDLMHREPGYCGRNRMLDKIGSVEEQLKLVKSGKEHPSKFFLHKSQLIERLNHFGEKLNNTPKFGDYHKRRTPKEVYQECFTTPLSKIPDELRYQLADNMVERPVGRNGITFRYGGRSFIYMNYRTGQLRGRMVKTWFSPENPEFLGVTDLNGQNPFVVPRYHKVPKYDAPETAPEIWARGNRQISEHNAYGKELIKMLKPHFDHDFQERMFRPVITDAQTLETAKEFKRQREELQTEESEQRSLTKRARRASEKVRFPVPPERVADEGVAEELEFLSQIAKGK